MKRTFTVDASKKVQAASDDEVIDPRMDQAEELQDKVADDFDYVMSGIERLVREGLTDDAINLLNTLSDTLNSAVSIIGNDFDKGE